MICYHIIQSFIFDLQTKFLLEENPPKQARVRLTLGWQIIYSSMICENNDFRAYQVGTKFLQCKYYGQQSFSVDA